MKCNLIVTTALGAETSNVRYSNKIAILAGDFLLARASVVRNMNPEWFSLDSDALCFRIVSCSIAKPSSHTTHLGGNSEFSGRRTSADVRCSHMIHQWNSRKC